MVNKLSVNFCKILLIMFSVVGVDLFAQNGYPDNIEEYVNEVCKKFEVPGTAVAIVKDGKVILTRGFGKKSLNTNEAVDENTLFGIASNSKAFTATALALLVEERKINWEDKVIKYLPWFRMPDPYITNEITIKDLLVHRSGLGLGAGDLLWWPSSEYKRNEICRRLKDLPLATSFRSAYAYDNVLYLVAGELIEAVSGLTWEDFVSKRILQKIGMTETKVRPIEAANSKNAAAPHVNVEGKIKVVSPFVNDNSNPAGGICTSARDIAKWMIMHLDSGKVAGQENLFLPAVTKKLWQIVTPMPIPNYPKELAMIKPNFYAYALGFQIKDYCGHKVVTHTGAYTGYYSQLVLIPDIKLGIAVLTNQESGYAFNSISYKLLDYYLNLPERDWLKIFYNYSNSKNADALENENMAEAKRNKNSHPSLPLESYAGLYTDKWYGDMMIVKKNDKLEISFAKTPSLAGELRHWQYDTFVIYWYDRELSADAFITFSLKPDGSIDEVKMEPVSSQTDFSFDFQDLLFKPASK